ncbi:MAG: hypothetical protein EHM81_08635 [Chloroflexi bacterium]|nr:MAG: hypothetical protein EHM81_08635 [Chloroflexota bacterium]
MRTKKLFLFFNLLVTFALLLNITQIAHASPSEAKKRAGNVYYVSTSGNDSNLGTQSQPWRTLGKAASKISAGDTLYIRGGVYQEAVTFSRSGTASAPIKILAYPGETPIVDGNNYKIPASTWGTILEISGSYVQVSGLEVRYSNWMGVVLSGDHITASGLNVHHIRETGMLLSGDYGLVESCRVWQAANRNETNSPYSGGGWATGLSAARHPNYAVLRGNVVYNNWGEGLSTFEANQVVMEGNIVYDNWSANVYISDATNVVMQRNLVYRSPNSIVQKGSRIGILMGDELYNPPSAGIKVINNLVYGTNRTFYWYQGPRGGGMDSVLVANNTFVNSVSGAGIQIDSGSHKNTRIENNIIQQDGSLPIASVDSTNGLAFSTNLWSKTPPSKLSSATDVVGDPQLAKTGQVEAGLLTAEWFRLLASSPARERAKIISEVPDDYFGNSRGIPADIGAIEYSTVVTQSNTFYSTAAYDGGILESSETSSKGGSIKERGKTFQLGDDAANRQYRAILSFDTSSLPDNAVIYSAVLRIKQYGRTNGSGPFSVLGNLLVDIRKGAFGQISLAAEDFQARSSAKNVGTFNSTPQNKWFSAALNAKGIKYINRSGNTQFRLSFSLDDNNDRGGDFMRFFSGNSVSWKPELIIQYGAP